MPGYRPFIRALLSYFFVLLGKVLAQLVWAAVGAKSWSAAGASGTPCLAAVSLSGCLCRCLVSSSHHPFLLFKTLVDSNGMFKQPHRFLLLRHRKGRHWGRTGRSSYLAGFLPGLVQGKLWMLKLKCKTQTSWPFTVWVKGLLLSECAKSCC